MQKSNNVRLVFGQTLLISVGILVVMGVEGLYSYLTGGEIVFPWYQPWAIILVGFVNSLPSVYWLGNEKILRNHSLLKIFIHFLLLYAITVGAGWVFRWYSSFEWLVAMSVGFVVVYIIVWTVTLATLKSEESKINEKLQEIQDED